MELNLDILHPALYIFFLYNWTTFKVILRTNFILWQCGQSMRSNKSEVEAKKLNFSRSFYVKNAVFQNFIMTYSVQCGKNNNHNNNDLCPQHVMCFLELELIYKVPVLLRWLLQSRGSSQLLPDEAIYQSWWNSFFWSVTANQAEGKRKEWERQREKQLAWGSLGS